MSEIPSKWSDLLIKAGFTDRRNGAPSLRRLGDAAGVNVSTVSRLVIKGMGLTDANMQKIADALRVSVDEVYGLTSGVTAKPMTLPLGTEKLTEREKNAVAEIIRSLVNSKELGSGEDDDPEKTSEQAEPAEEKTQSHYDLVARQERHGRTTSEPPRRRRKPAE